MDQSLAAFFNPRGIVVVGASASPEKLGYGIARNLFACKYPGTIQFVGQKAGELFGLPIQTDIARLTDPLDLAILVVPPGATPEAIEACGRRGIKAAIIVSAGFRESGPEGQRLEEMCLEIARGHGMRLLGPNCIGTLDTHLPLDTTFLRPPLPAQGCIGFISHSGAFCAAVIDWARHQGFGFSRIASLGNQADVNETDMLQVFAGDELTRVIVMYMESISDGRRFVTIASEVTVHKPVIALKAGRFEAGQKAAASHTGALAVSDVAFEAAFEKAGILRADGGEQMFDWARAVADCPLPRGDRMAVLTNAGGPGVIAVDAIQTNGLTLAALNDETRAALSRSLPTAASVRNPVDMLASASPEQYAACLEPLLHDPGVDGIMVILPPPPMFRAEDVSQAVIPIIDASNKPAVIVLMGSELTAVAGEQFQKANIPTYPFPERAASALGALVRRARYLERPRTSSASARPPAPTTVGSPTTAGTFPTQELIAAYGIQITPTRLARSVEEAKAAAREVGFPVVLKISSPDILHKSDVGGVVEGIGSEQAVGIGYAKILADAHLRGPGARIDGIQIQRQIPPGQDVILGAVRDPQFGPLMMFGSGGIEVEGLKDVAFALAPLDETEAHRLIDKTWAGRKLKGFRSLPAADERAVCDAMVMLSWLAHEHPEIGQIEINPLRVLGPGEGAFALDIRVSMVSG